MRYPPPWRHRGVRPLESAPNRRQIVGDLQNGLMDYGQVAEMPIARKIVPDVNRISSALRPAGGIIVYFQHKMDAEVIRIWPIFFEHCGPEYRARMIETITPGNPGHSLWSELDVAQQRLAALSIFPADRTSSQSRGSPQGI
jgi:ureidoacrylate peracid hydrolase